MLGIRFPCPLACLVSVQLIACGDPRPEAVVLGSPITATTTPALSEPSVGAAIEVLSGTHPATTVGGGVAFSAWQVGLRATIQARRVRLATGEPLDARGIVIDQFGLDHPEDPNPELWPQVAFDGLGTFFVVYALPLDGVGQGLTVVARRIRATDGALLDPQPLTVSDHRATTPDVRVSSGAGTVFITWESQGQPFARELRNDGVLVDSQDVLLTPPPLLGGSGPVVAKAGAGWVVTWKAGGLWCRYLDSARHLFPPTLVQDLVQGDDVVHGVAMAGDIAHAWIVWRDLRAGEQYFAATYDTRTQGIDAGPIPVVTNTRIVQLSDQIAPAISTDGLGNALIAWTMLIPPLDAPYYRAFVRRLGPGLVPLDGPVIDGGQIIADERGSSAVSLAMTQTQAYAVYSTRRNDALEDGLVGQRLLLTSSISAAAPGDLMRRSTDQRSPWVAATSDNFMVAWIDAGGDGHPRGVYQQRLRASDGQSLDRLPVLVTSTVPTWSTNPLATNGTDYAILHWDGAAGLFLRRVQGRDGVVLGETALPEGVTSARLAYAAGTYLVSYSTDCFGCCQGFNCVRAYFSRIDAASGVLLQPDRTLLTNDDYIYGNPQLTCTATQCLAFWEGLDARRQSRSLLARIDPLSGTLSSTTTIVLPFSTPSSAPNDGHSVLTLSWENAGLMAHRVSFEGTVLDRSPIPIEANPGGFMSAAFDGDDFVVATTNQALGEGRLIQVAPEGLVRGVYALPFGPGYSDATPSIGSAANHLSLVAQSTLEPGRPENLSRLVFRLYTTRLLPGRPCAENKDCASGFCVDGVCCNEVCGGGNSVDCMACSLREGGLVNGTCGPRICRASQGTCDIPETCTGTTSVCPSDRVLAARYPCRPASGPCDLAEACDGLSPSCPADTKTSTSVVCRPETNSCDQPELCDGVQDQCPPAQSTPCPDASVSDSGEGSADTYVDAGTFDDAPQIDADLGDSAPRDSTETYADAAADDLSAPDLGGTADASSARSDAASVRPDRQPTSCGCAMATGVPETRGCVMLLCALALLRITRRKCS